MSLCRGCSESGPTTPAGRRRDVDSWFSRRRSFYLCRTAARRRPPLGPQRRSAFPLGGRRWLFIALLYPRGRYIIKTQGQRRTAQAPQTVSRLRPDSPVQTQGQGSSPVSDPTLWSRPRGETVSRLRPKSLEFQTQGGGMAVTGHQSAIAGRLPAAGDVIPPRARVHRRRGQTVRRLPTSDLLHGKWHTGVADAKPHLSSSFKSA